MGTERIHRLLNTHRGKFEKLLTEALAKGRARWAQQAAELHTFRVDHENRAKQAKGFFKQNDESIATVREDLATDYQDLADQHLEEVAQILQEYGAAKLEIGHQLQATEADRLATGQQTIETLDLPDHPPEDTEPTLQETSVDATSKPPVSEPTLTKAMDSAPRTCPTQRKQLLPCPQTCRCKQIRAQPWSSQHPRSSPRNKHPHQRNLHQSQNPPNPFKQTSLPKRKE